MKYNLWDLPKLFWRILFFLDLHDILRVMRVSQRLRVLSSHDNMWREILLRFNLQALLTVPISKPLYEFFCEDVITTRVLHGRYEYQSEKGLVSSHMQPYDMSSVTLLVSSASFGNEHHSMGRIQMMLCYRSGQVEILQGALRFSMTRGCFCICSSVFGATVRGPVFSVAIAQSNRKWANQSQQLFKAHKGGIRLVMTPALMEGKTKGSMVNESDVIAVSRPPPEGVEPINASEFVQALSPDRR